MEYIYILIGAIFIIGTLHFFTKSPKKKAPIAQSVIQKDIILASDTDAYAQTVLAAFNSGNVVYYNAGDDHMKQVDKDTGDIIEVKLRK